MATTTSPQRRAGGMSLIEVLRNIDGARPVAPAPRRRTAHPTGEAWIPPSERALSARPPLADPDDDPLKVVRTASSRALEAAAQVSATGPAPDPRDPDHDVEVVVGGPAPRAIDPRDPGPLDATTTTDAQTTQTDLEAPAGGNRLRREALELLRELDRIA